MPGTIFCGFISNMLPHLVASCCFGHSNRRFWSTLCRILLVYPLFWSLYFRNGLNALRTPVLIMFWNCQKFKVKFKRQLSNTILMIGMCYCIDFYGNSLSDKQSFYYIINIPIYFCCLPITMQVPLFVSTLLWKYRTTLLVDSKTVSLFVLMYTLALVPWCVSWSNWCYFIWYYLRWWIIFYFRFGFATEKVVRRCDIHRCYT